MLPAEALENYEKLPSKAQQQVIDFIDFMRERYRSPKAECDPPEKGIESSFGLLRARKTVSLEEMDKAIEAEGGKL